MKIRKTLLLSLVLLAASPLFSQQVNVLFLGNSYVAVNNLPATISSLLEGSDKKMYYDSNTPGGCTLDMHSTSEASLEKIRLGGWDYVVLQEQSQMPTIDYYRYALMYPAVERLRDSIMKYNPCATVLMYMTWGRRYGGQQCEDYGAGTYCSAEFRDFDHMQDSLTSAYCEIGNRIGGAVAPVGEAWRQCLRNTDIVLHASDNSHPNVKGTYLIACVFYGMLWNEVPSQLPPLSIDSTEAVVLQDIAGDVVFQSGVSWNIEKKIEAGFDFEVSGSVCKFHNTTTAPFPIQFLWDFGDGETSTDENPTHEYELPGEHLVRLTATGCNKVGIVEKTVTTEVTSTDESDGQAVGLFSNPANSQLTLTGIGDSASVEVYDVSGRLVLQTYGTSLVDVSGLCDGIYALRVKGATLKFAVKR